MFAKEKRFWRLLMFEMKKDFFTGIEAIDTEHGKLFELADLAYTLLKDEYAHDKYDKIIALIEELKEYAIFHFKHEEEYMESIKHKRLFSQKMEHQAFVDKLNELDLESIDENQDHYIEEILEFLNDWLVHHILEKDMLIGK